MGENMEYKYLVCIKANENNYKYYTMIPKGDCFEVQYGRVGNSNYQTATYPASYFNKKYNEKIKKGYVDKTELKSELIEEKIEEKSPLAEIKNRSVALIIKRLQDFANNTIKANYTVAQAEITQAMVDEAQSILSNMVSIDTVEDFNEQLLKLMAVIPRKVKRVKDYLPKTLEEVPRIIQLEQDLLDTLSGNIYKKPEVKEDIKKEVNKTKTILDEMGIEMSETDDSDVKLIKEMLGQDANRYINSWRVNNLETKKNFDKFVKDYNIKNTKLLWHGSRSENFIGIIKMGLRIRPSNAVYTGSMFSDGCYFSTLARKSIGYCSANGSYWARGNNPTGFMAIFEVAYGNPYTVYQHTSECYHLNFDVLQKKKPPCHCLYASPEKGMLRNPEIVFYRTDQMTIKYLVEIK